MFFFIGKRTEGNDSGPRLRAGTNINQEKSSVAIAKKKRGIIIMEKHFKINIDPFELTSEDLLSISSISKFIYGKLNKK